MGGAGNDSADCLVAQFRRRIGLEDIRDQFLAKLHMVRSLGRIYVQSLHKSGYYVFSGT